MLEPQAKKMLKHLRGNEPPDGEWDVDAFRESYAALCGRNEWEVSACLDYLKKEGLVKDVASPSGIAYYFSLDHRARRHLWFVWADWLRFIRNSILVPIVVAMLTTLLTLAAINLLRDLLPEWLVWLLSATQ